MNITSNGVGWGVGGGDPVGWGVGGGATGAGLGKSYANTSISSSSSFPFGTAIIANTIVSIYGNILEGYVRRAQAKVTEAQYNYNAVIAEGKINFIKLAKGVSNQRWMKAKGSTLSKSMAIVGASGLMPVGSSQAVMVETQRQMNIDHIIEMANYDQEMRYTESEAKGLRYAGQQMKEEGQSYVRQGFTNAFSSALTGASKYALYKYGYKLTQEGTIKNTIFD